MSVNPLDLLFGAAGLLLKPFGGNKTPPPPAAVPTLQRNDTSAADALADRRGSLANRRTGAGGAEAPAFGQKTKLGQ